MSTSSTTSSPIPSSPSSTNSPMEFLRVPSTHTARTSPTVSFGTASTATLFNMSKVDSAIDFDLFESVTPVAAVESVFDRPAPRLEDKFGDAVWNGISDARIMEIIAENNAGATKKPIHDDYGFDAAFHNGGADFDVPAETVNAEKGKRAERILDMEVAEEKTASRLGGPGEAEQMRGDLCFGAEEEQEILEAAREIVELSGVSMYSDSPNIYRPSIIESSSYQVFDVFAQSARNPAWQCHVLPQSSGSISRILMSPLDGDLGASATSTPPLARPQTSAHLPTRPLPGLAVPNQTTPIPTNPIRSAESLDDFPSDWSCLSIEDLARCIASRAAPPPEQPRILPSSSSDILPVFSPRRPLPTVFHNALLPSSATFDSSIAEAADSPRHIVDQTSPRSSQTGGFRLVNSVSVSSAVSEKEDGPNMRSIVAVNRLVGLGLGNAAGVLQTSSSVTRLQDLVGQAAEARPSPGLFGGAFSPSMSMSTSFIGFLNMPSPNLPVSMLQAFRAQPMLVDPSHNDAAHHSLSQDQHASLLASESTIRPYVPQAPSISRGLGLAGSPSIPPSSKNILDSYPSFDRLANTVTHGSSQALALESAQLDVLSAAGEEPPCGIVASTSARSFNASKSAEGLGLGLPSTMASRPSRPRDMSPADMSPLVAAPDPDLALWASTSSLSLLDITPSLPRTSRLRQPAWRLRKRLPRKLSDIPEEPTPSPEPFSPEDRRVFSPQRAYRRRESPVLPSIEWVLSKASKPQPPSMVEDSSSSSTAHWKPFRFFALFSRSRSRSRTSSSPSPSSLPQEGSPKITTPPCVIDGPRALFARRNVRSRAPKPSAPSVGSSRPLSYLF